MADDVKDGKLTSEHQAAQSAGVWGIVGMALGLLVAFGDQIATVLGHGTGNAGLIAGAVIAVAGILLRTLTTLGYIKSRTDVKVAASVAPVTPNVGAGSQ